MSDPLEARCPDCGRGPLECEVLLAVRGGLSGWDVHAQLGCSAATVARLRASLSTAEKERDEARANSSFVAFLSVAGERDTLKAALEKALGALRAVLDTTCDDHADMCCVEWCGRCRDEAVARKAGYAILSGGAHVDALKAQKEEEK